MLNLSPTGKTMHLDAKTNQAPAKMQEERRWIEQREL